MAFIVTSKNKAKPPTNSRRLFVPQGKIYGDSIRGEATKSEQEIADQKAWLQIPETERTKIAVEQMKEHYVEENRQRGLEVKDHGALDKMFSDIAEHKDKS